VAGQGNVKLGNNRVEVTQTTNYPWDGAVKISIDPEKESEFSVYVRIPGWVHNEPVPSDLYSFLDPQVDNARFLINGAEEDMEIEKGYARIHRKWRKGDTIALDLPMTVRRVVAHDKVEEDRGKVALQRGPLVFCFEGIDNGDRVLDRKLPDEMAFSTEFRLNLLGGITVIGGTVPETSESLAAVPYFAWSHRGTGEMAVWLPRK
jgi:hypothetical protein